MISRYVRGYVLAALLGVMMTAGSALAQPAWQSQRAEIARAQLDSLLAEYERTAASSEHSEAVRSDARREAELIRNRLEEGDFESQLGI